jgi:CelD/BcsL family acetyltransferase involved in cellulose biosynthesis
MDNAAADLVVALLDAEEAGAIAPAWDDLHAADPEATFFLSRPFLGPVFAAYPRLCRLVTVWDRDRLLALMPLRFGSERDRASGAFHTNLMMAGTLFWADYTGFLVRPGVETAALDALAEGVSRLGWRHLRLKNLRASEARRAAFLRRFEASGEFAIAEETVMINDGSTNNLLCPRIALPATFEDYLAGLGRSTRQNLRRQLRRLDDGEFTIRMGATREDADAVAALWAGLWREAKPRSIGELEQDCREILGAGLGMGAMSMPILEHQGAMRGALVLFEDRPRREVLFFLSGRDPAFDAAPVGLILHADAIRRAIADGARVYDFMRGDESYKLQLGGAPEPIHFPIVSRAADAPAAALLDALSLRGVLGQARKMLDAGDADGARAAIAQVRRRL